MAPRFEKSAIQLDYPPVALDFDSQDANRIVVGGGGGPRRDVKNKIVSYAPSLHPGKWLTQ
jgi:hypothetical protein